MSRYREHRVRNGTERSGDDWLVERLTFPPVRFDFSCFPPFPVTQKRVSGRKVLILGCMSLHGPDRVGLAPATRPALVRHPPRPCGPVISHQRCAPPIGVLSLQVSPITRR